MSCCNEKAQDACAPKEPQCENVCCRLTALETNVDELFNRTLSLRQEIEEISPFVIAFLADTGTPGETQDKFVSMIASWKPNLVVLGGDNAYSSGTDEQADAAFAAFEQFIELENLIPVVGNHDEITSQIPLYSNYLYRKFPYLYKEAIEGSGLGEVPYFRMPITAKNAELFFLYSGVYSNGDFSQYGLAGSALYAARATADMANSPAKQVLAFSHHSFVTPNIDGTGIRAYEIRLYPIGSWKSFFVGHTHTAYHLKGNDGSDYEGFNVFECSATTETPRLFQSPYALEGRDTADFSTVWKYDEATRYAIRISIFSDRHLVEFVNIDGYVNHSYTIKP